MTLNPLQEIVTVIRKNYFITHIVGDADFHRDLNLKTIAVRVDAPIVSLDHYYLIFFYHLAFNIYFTKKRKP